MTTIASSFLIGSSLFLQVTRTTIKSRRGSKFGKIGPGTEELATPERLKNAHTLIMGEMLCSALVLGEPSLFSQVTRTTIKA